MASRARTGRFLQRASQFAGIDLCSLRRKYGEEEDFRHGLDSFSCIGDVVFVRSWSGKASRASAFIVPVKAKNFEFEPAVIHVKAGEKIQLKLCRSIARTEFTSTRFRKAASPTRRPDFSSHMEMIAEVAEGSDRDIGIHRTRPRNVYIFVLQKMRQRTRQDER